MSAHNSIEIRRELTRLTYIRLNLLITLRKWYVWVIITASIIFLITSLIYGFSSLVPALILSFCLLYSPLYACYLAYNSKNSSFFLPAEYNFSDDSISVKTPLTQGTLKWDVFHNWTVVDGYYILYITTQGFTAIPKSAIPSQDIQSFESLLRTKISSKK